MEFFLTLRSRHESTSPFYPPRARWYGAVFYPWFLARRVFHWEQIHLPVGLTIQQFILSLLLPGYAFFADGRPKLGWAFLGVYFYSAALFLVALGYQLGSVGYGLMISVHASSIIYLQTRWLREFCRFSFRLVLAICTLLLVWGTVYRPVVHFAQAHWIMPLRVRGHVVIVRRLAPPAKIGRGDWVMCSFQEQSIGDPHGGGAVWLRAGISCGPVLAIAGDRVTFSTNSFLVNGVAQASRALMPTSGEVVVPEKHWFVWPDLDISGRGEVGEERRSTAMLQAAVVSQAEYVGRPFKRWFWRKQIIDMN